MAINILIPIDFSVESLNTLKIALEEHKNEQVKVTLIFTQHLSTSITDLLFHSKSKIIKSLAEKDFMDALNILKNTYESSLKDVKIELFHGSTANALNNFASAKNIDFIYIPQTYSFKLKNNAFDPLPLIKTSKLPFKEVTWTSDQRSADNNSINLLFT